MQMVNLDSSYPPRSPRKSCSSTPMIQHWVSPNSSETVESRPKATNGGAPVHTQGTM